MNPGQAFMTTDRSSELSAVLRCCDGERTAFSAAAGPPYEARSEARLRDLYEGSSDAIFVHDAQTGEILDVNQTMCAMYGYPREECVTLGVLSKS